MVKILKDMLVLAFMIGTPLNLLHTDDDTSIVIEWSILSVPRLTLMISRVIFVLVYVSDVVFTNFAILFIQYNNKKSTFST